MAPFKLKFGFISYHHLKNCCRLKAKSRVIDYRSSCKFHIILVSMSTCALHWFQLPTDEGCDASLIFPASFSPTYTLRSFPVVYEKHPRLRYGDRYQAR